MVARVATFRNRRYNSYVPAAAYAADVGNDGPYQVDFGTPAAANPTLFLNGASIAVAGPYQGTVGTFGLASDTIVEPYGRNVQVVASAANATVVTVRGRDYMGQPVREDITLNGAAAVQGVKAFKWIDSLSFTVTAGQTINFGTGSRVGLPYRMHSVVTEEGNGQGATVTAANLTPGNVTDPQTATSSDPRGLYTPTTAFNGTNRIRVFFMPNNLLNANGNGGLYGLPHFYG